MRIWTIISCLFCFSFGAELHALVTEDLPPLTQSQYRWFVLNADHLWLQLPGGVVFQLEYDGRLAEESSDTPYQITELKALPAFPENQWIRCITFESTSKQIEEIKDEYRRYVKRELVQLISSPEEISELALSTGTQIWTSSSRNNRQQTFPPEIQSVDAQTVGLTLGMLVGFFAARGIALQMGVAHLRADVLAFSSVIGTLILNAVYTGMKASPHSAKVFWIDRRPWLAKPFPRAVIATSALGLTAASCSKILLFVTSLF